MKLGDFIHLYTSGSCSTAWRSVMKLFPLEILWLVPYFIVSIVNAYFDIKKQKWGEEQKEIIEDVINNEI